MANPLLDLLLPPPDFSVRGTLEITALAPLSMVAKLPGKYYTSQSQPTELMVLGMLENAFGWHIGEVERGRLVKILEKKHKLKGQASGSKFVSLLQWHIFLHMERLPPLLHYDDLWTQQLRGKSFHKNSRNHDVEAIPIMNAKKGGYITVSDGAKTRKDSAALHDFQKDEVIDITVLRPYFPQYYSSPTLRGYVEPQGPYRIEVKTSAALAAALREAVADPAAPLYLGSNDGWVELDWYE